MDAKKLAIGESIVMCVHQVEEISTGKWPEYHWTAQDGQVYVTPKAAMDRQLKDHLKMTLGSVVGECIRIERAPNKEDATKSWWNAYPAAPADLKPAAPTKRLTHAEASRSAGPGLDDDIPLPDDPFADDMELYADPVALPGAPDTVFVADPTALPTDTLMDAYFELAERVAAFQAGLCKEYEMPFDASSVNAMTFSIWHKR